METRELRRSRILAQAPTRPIMLGLGVAGTVAAILAVAVSPVVLGWIYAGSRDYAAVGNIGQAYGGASALVAAIALVIVGMSALLQRRTAKAAQVQCLVDMNEALVSLAMQNPAYRQCFGPRVSPDDIDEDLYYFCGKVVRLWTSGWELGILDEVEARQYLRRFFDSEVPRLYWSTYGDWHVRGPARGRRIQFRSLINEEYLRAVKHGAPSRRYEFNPAVLSAAFGSSNTEGKSGQGTLGARGGRRRRPA